MRRLCSQKPDSLVLGLVVLAACSAGTAGGGGNGPGTSTTTVEGGGPPRGGASASGNPTGSSSSGTSTSSSGKSTSSSGTSTSGCTVFPANNVWNTDISAAPVDPNSDAYINSIGSTLPLHPDFGSAFGIPSVGVLSTAPKVAISFDTADESDPGPYPIPANPPLEQDSDAHMLLLATDTCVLYETWRTSHPATGWHAGSGAIWDLNKNSTRPAGWTSADAAGLPIYPGLARYDEAVTKGEINHALRFTTDPIQAAYVSPASHIASSNTDTNLPPYGLRVRLKASVNISSFAPELQVILRALKKYGMILADGGQPWFISGAPDTRWNDDHLHAINRIYGSDFEAIKTGPLTTK